MSKLLGTSDRVMDLSDGAIERIRNWDEMHAHKMLTKVRLRVQIVKRRKRFILQTIAVFGVSIGAYSLCQAVAKIL